jgi:pyrroloquinoline quinone (PQQ) biosynthesis protein C
LVFDAIDEAIIAKPTWADLQPTMQQYANLYPLMSKGIFNLAKQAVVDQHAQILKLVFTKDKTDPNYMPAVRDLSRDKTQMIVNYLDGVLKKEKEAAASTHKD